MIDRMNREEVEIPNVKRLIPLGLVIDWLMQSRGLNNNELIQAGKEEYMIYHMIYYILIPLYVHPFHNPFTRQ